MDLLIDFRKLLLSGKKSGIQDVMKYIEKNLINGEYSKFICTEILHVSIIRPFFTEFLAEIVILASKIPYLLTLKTDFLNFIEYIHGPLLRMLYDKKLYTLDDLQILFSNKKELTAFFAPELHLTQEDFQSIDQLKPLANSFEQLESNDWEMFKEMINLGFVQNTIGFAMKFDDPSLISEFVLMDFDIKGNTGPSLHETVAGFNLSLINAAALYASPNCFKELLMNGVELKEDVCEYAVLGGNKEIINTCLKKFPKSKKFIPAAIKGNQNNILIELVNAGVSVSTNIYFIVESHNYFALDYLLNKKLVDIDAQAIQKANKLAEQNNNFELFGVLKKLTALPKLKK